MFMVAVFASFKVDYFDDSGFWSSAPGRVDVPGVADPVLHSVTVAGHLFSPRRKLTTSDRMNSEVESKSESPVLLVMCS